MLGRPAVFRRRLLDWYGGHRRTMPWRPEPGASPHPYHVLVSEIMLQQTQVATVIPYFQRFLAEFPTLAELARAPEQRVLRLWQGLGYYRRARQLQACARLILRRHGGAVPDDLDELLALPGIGRYTAGAVASLAFGRRAAVLDGNVARVLCRLDATTLAPAPGQLWARAEEFLPRRPSDAGDFNSALMDLGATVCTPRSPHCGACPVRLHCQARAGSLQDRIPAPRRPRALPLARRVTFCVRQGPRWLIEQRPVGGRWPRLWQFPTIDAPASRPVLTKLGDVSHTLTHRRYRFEVYLGAPADNLPLPIRRRRWVTLRQLPGFPLPKPHLRIAQMLAVL